MPDTLNGLVRERLDAQPPEVQEVLAVVAALADPTLPLVEATAPARRDRRRRARRARWSPRATASGSRTRCSRRRRTRCSARSARRDLHRRLAEIVRDGEERARHLSLAADGPSAEVAAALHDAARAAAGRGAIGAAAELADRAVRLTPPDLAELLALRQRDAASYQVRHGDASRARVPPRGARRARAGRPAARDGAAPAGAAAGGEPRRVARDLRAGDRRGRRRPRRRRGAPARGRDVDAERQRDRARSSRRGRRSSWPSGPATRRSSSRASGRSATTRRTWARSRRG